MPPQRIPAAARSISAPGKTIAGSFPPSSNEIAVNALAPAAAISSPTSVLPVKQTKSTCGIMAWPTSAAPSTVPNRSRSTGTRSIERANGARKRGVTSLGLIITAQPAASAGIASMQPSSNGKFQGLITPTS